MAITYVGGKTGVLVSAATADNTTTVTLSSGLTGGSNTGVSAGDIVVVTVGSSGTADYVLFARDPSSVAYTLVASELYVNSSQRDANMRVMYKFMPATPDASVIICPSGALAAHASYVIQVFRGVDPVTPLDVTALTATGTGNVSADPPSITPVTTGAFVVCAGVGAASDSATNAAYTNASLTNVVGRTGSVLLAARSYVSSGYFAWTSGAFNASVFVVASPTGTGRSWAAVSLVLRPLVTGKIKYWNGAAWVAKPVKVWNGSSWVTKPVKRWNGSAWVTTNY